MAVDEVSHILDNVGWAALNSHHANFAISNGLAKRYLPDIAPFAALSEYTDAAFADLAGIVSKGEMVDLSFWQRQPQVPPDWTIVHSLTLKQMVSKEPLADTESSVEVVNLTDTDVPDMLRLVELTEPGPFRPRTIELGRYIGIRQQGQLISMAGERRRLQGYSEISAVCTHPDHQGKGYARLLISQLVNENWRRASVPFLHVRPQNVRAIQLYQHLNFYTRGEVHIVVLQR